MARWLAGGMAAVLLSACGATGGTVPSGTPSPSQSPSAPAAMSPTPTATPSASAAPSPVPTPTPPAGFVCAAVTGGTPAASTVTTVRVGQHPGYDRFVIEFGGGVTSFSVRPQSSASFTRSPKGDLVTLEGSAGVLVVVNSVSNWTSYTGPTAFTPRYPYLRQALQVENFEGYQQWALGIAGTPCVRVAVYSAPSRLVVDVVGI